jgi:hypothetical protein
MTSKKIWEEIVKRAQEKPVFLSKKSVTMGIVIYPDEPKEQEIEGKFGKRQMYLVKSNFGWLALDKKSFLQLAQLMHDADYKPINVTYDHGLFILSIPFIGIFALHPLAFFGGFAVLGYF